MLTYPHIRGGGVSPGGIGRAGTRAQRPLTSLLVVGFLVLAWGLSHAQEIPPVTPPAAGPDAAEDAGAPVTLAGRELLRVTGPNAEERARRIESRLQTLVTREQGVDSFTIEPQGENYVILIGDIPVMTVTPEDARGQAVDQETLARRRGQTLAGAVRDARAERESWIRRVTVPLVRSFRDLGTQALQAAPRLLAALILLVITLYVARLVRALARVALRRQAMDPNVQHLVRTFAFYGTWIIGLLLVASVMGLNVSSLVTALGLGAFALGFALKDILSHFLAGIVLLLGRAFRIGDQIAVRDFEGTVERIDLRATSLRTYDNRLVIIPNADVFTSAVVNNTESARRRQEFDVHISYDADVATAQSLAFRAIQGTEGVLPEPSPDVLVAELEEKWVTLRCRFYTDPVWRNVLAVGSEARRRLKDTFLREGIPFAYRVLDGLELHFEPPVREPLRRALASVAGEPPPPEETAARAERVSPRPPSPPATEEELRATEKEAEARVDPALPQDRTAEYH